MTRLSDPLLFRNISDNFRGTTSSTTVAEIALMRSFGTSPEPAQPSRPSRRTLLAAAVATAATAAAAPSSPPPRRRPNGAPPSAG